MKKLLLATVATIALTAGTGLAAESGGKAGVETKGQAAGQAQPGGTGVAGPAQTKSEHGMTTGADGKGAAGMKSETTGSGALEERSGETGKPGAMKNGENGKSGSTLKHNGRATTGAGTMDDKSKAETGKPGAKAETKSDTKSGANVKGGASSAGGQAGTKSSATTGAAPSAEVNLTSEQKTKIRTTVLAKAPKVSRSEVNFTVNVGTVVPRSVHLVAVPPTLVEIHPAWRGYRYFVIGDEIVIVEPATLKIVYILTV